MGLLDRLFGRAEREDRQVEMLRVAGLLDDPDSDELVEVEVVGESYRQDALARIAGPKEMVGKHHPVGVTLRCEPRNDHDRNAIRVEVLGLHVGYIARHGAAKLSPMLQRSNRGVVECQGLVVGGWKDESSEGHYGIRAYFDGPTAARLGLRRGDHIPDVQWVASLPVPDLPALATGEVRLTPTPESSARVSSVTVTCEEHYQAAVLASKPAEWDRSWWPVLATWVIAEANPHTKASTSCIEIRLGGATVGYLTPKMTARYLDSVRAAIASGGTVTSRAEIARGEKGGVEVWRVKLATREMA